MMWTPRALIPCAAADDDGLGALFFAVSPGAHVATCPTVGQETGRPARARHRFDLGDVRG